MRLTSWNFLHGLPTPQTERTHLELSRVIAALKADVLGLQEVDHLLGRSGGENQVAQIAHLMGTAHWAFALSVVGSPDENWRAPGKSDVTLVTEAVPGAPGYGIGLISKIPVTSWHRLELTVAPIGIRRIYVHDHPRSAIAAVLENGWLVINTHLSFVPFFTNTPLPGLSESYKLPAASVSAKANANPCAKGCALFSLGNDGFGRLAILLV